MKQQKRLAACVGLALASALPVAAFEVNEEVAKVLDEKQATRLVQAGMKAQCARYTSFASQQTMEIGGKERIVWINKGNSEGTQKDLDGLSHVGLLERIELPQGEPKVVYGVTEKGMQYLDEPRDRMSGFCAGQQELVRVVKAVKDSDDPRQRFTRYHIYFVSNVKDMADWAKDPEFRRLARWDWHKNLHENAERRFRFTRMANDGRWVFF